VEANFNCTSSSCTTTYLLLASLLQRLNALAVALCTALLLRAANAASTSFRPACSVAVRTAAVALAVAAPTLAAAAVAAAAAAVAAAAALAAAAVTAAPAAAAAVVALAARRHCASAALLLPVTALCRTVFKILLR
jgi:hypothetical protein